MKNIYFSGSVILFVMLILPFSGLTQHAIGKTSDIDALSASVDKKDASGSDTNDAYIRLKITGGKAPYTIHCFSPYSLPTKSQGNELKLENIKSGDYAFVIQDSGGKTISKEIKISDNR
jgi:hypothetical protein